MLRNLVSKMYRCYQVQGRNEPQALDTLCQSVAAHLQRFSMIPTERAFELFKAIAADDGLRERLSPASEAVRQSIIANMMVCGRDGRGH